MTTEEQADRVRANRYQRALDRIAHLESRERRLQRDLVSLLSQVQAVLDEIGVPAVSEDEL